MTIQISIVKGYYRGELVTGIFPLVKSYQNGAKGGFVTIKNSNPKSGHPPVQRVQIEKTDFTLIDEAGEKLADHIVLDTNEKSGKLEVNVDYEHAFTQNESEDEAMDRISSSFLMLDKITDACSKGIIRGLIVSGPPGIGKSFGVEKQLDTANIFLKLNGRDPKYEVISGGISSIGLYQKLYHRREADQVLVFDDADEIFSNEECLNLLKAALNSGEKRRICWNKESRVLALDDIPEAFDFEASVIFLSNIDFETSIARGSRIANHLSALMSRCHYLDLRIGSTRDKLLRIKQVVRDGMLNSFEFSEEEVTSIIDFVFNNSEHMREISLRAVKKLADLVKMDPDDWYVTAESTLLYREALFKRLLNSKQQKMKDLEVTMMT